MNIFYIIFIIHSIKFAIIFSEETIKDNCPNNTPFSFEENSCIYQCYIDNEHFIEFEIIKEQILNRKNPLVDSDTSFIYSDFSSNGDLIIESFEYSHIFLYGIKSNGRPLFYDEGNNEFTYQINIATQSNQNSENPILEKRNLFGYDEKNYYIRLNFSTGYAIDIIDLYSKNIISQESIFGEIDLYSKYYNILKLGNEDKTYLFFFLGEKYDNNIDYYYYLSFQKFQFKNLEPSENNYRDIFKNDLKVQEASTLTCIEILKYNLIQCFYINYDGYLTIGLFNETNLELIKNETIDNIIIDNERDNYYDEQFHKSILLKDEISILYYNLYNNFNDYFNNTYLQIKNIII